MALRTPAWNDGGYADIVEQSITVTVGDHSIRVMELESLNGLKRELDRPKGRAVLSVLETVVKRRPGS